MTHFDQPKTITARDLMIALSDAFPDSTYGAVPVADQYNALEAYLASANGALAANTEIAFPFVTTVAR